MAGDLITRDELMAAYAHPYRHWLPVAWEIGRLRRTTLVGGVVAVGCGTAWLVGGQAVWAILLVATILVVLAVYAVWLVPAAAMIARRTHGWNRPSELGDVRAARPHAGDRDPELAHDEFAVTVETSGSLWVWRFVPLAIDERAGAGAIEVPGRPRHGATVERELPFDADDTARAAEQLVEAQALAAELEGEAARRAADLQASAAARRAQDAATAQAAATLQHLTGQTRR